MATATAVPEKTRTFSFRSSLAPTLSIRRPKSSPGPERERNVLKKKAEAPPPQLPQLSTSFVSSNPKYTVTTTTTTTTESVPPYCHEKSPTDVAVSLLSLEPCDTRSSSDVQRDPVVETAPPCSSPVSDPALAPLHRSISASTQPKIMVSEFVKSLKAMDDTSYQGGLEISATESGKAAKSDSSVRTRSTSRSPSQSSRDDESSRGEDSSTAASSVSSTTSPARSTETVMAKPTESSSTESSPDRPQLARSNTLGKRARRLSLFLKNAPPMDNNQPPMPPLPHTSPPSADRLPPNANFKKVKDEMWEAYKTLEAEHQKFQSKSNPQKATIIRQSLLTFLRKYKDKSSNNISPEMLEKRARTLHRWWTSLLAQLRNRNTQAISGADRFVYLEALSFIISRPEWRTAPSTFAPLSERTPMSAASSSSLASSSSSFSLQKSVQHNIKVLYTRTLFDTLAFTVEKMALRVTPPALVAFGGKVIAYAFFFCQGVAEMLISLWGLSPATLRRVLPEFGVGRGTDLRHVSEDVVCEFPEPLHSLGFTTLKSFIREHKKPVQAPVGVQVDWYGPWITRWCGRDTDLVYAFIKNYHILMCEYLPPNPSFAARLCAPGYISVLSQMLQLVDNTIHRNAEMSMNELSAGTVTFDGLLNTSAAIPLPSRNVPRVMADNKLLVLLQDILADDSCTRNCRTFYTASFVAMTKAAVQKTQLYDSDACYQICDLLEELLPILERVSQQGLGDFIDWPFWLDVIQTMLKSVNNMTELRVITFVYSAWSILVADERRKEMICVEWILSVPIWERFFCHWCPMVRAYYMRLLCWRLGRYDGDATEIDTLILRTLLLRLRTGYAHHVQMKKNFETCGGKPSSTAPCLPAPSRRLVILRNDAIAAAQGVLLEGIIPTSASTPFVPTSGSLLRTQSAPAAPAAPAAPVTTTSAETAKAQAEPAKPDVPASSGGRRWSSIRNAFGFKSAITKAAAAPEAPVRSNSTGNLSTTSQPEKSLIPLRLPSFKFSLEWIEQPLYGRERILSLSRLPAPAQRYLESTMNDISNIEVTAESLAAKHWTYIGRALSEWILVIVEYESFFDRRKMEGRETDKMVETPSLGVDSMRKF